MSKDLFKPELRTVYGEVSVLSQAVAKRMPNQLLKSMLGMHARLLSVTGPQPTDPKDPRIHVKQVRDPKQP